MSVMRSATGGILSYMTRHRTAANLFLLIMLLAGAVSFPQMRAQFFPDVIIDNVTVSVRWDGAGPEDVDRAIVQIVEPALLGIEGVMSTSSTSSEGSARIRMEFEPGWDMARGTDDTQIAVDSVASQFPEDADDPRVARGFWRDRVTDVVISGPAGIEQLALFADEFVTRLFATGVTRASIRGVAAGSTIVEVDSLSLIRNDVSMAQIASAIAEEAQADPAGDVAGAARIRTGVAKRGARDIGEIVLRSNADGSTLTVVDVAAVIEEGVDRDRAYFVGGASAISIRIDRSDQGDAIEIQAQVQEVAEAMIETLPPEVKVELIRTRSEVISARLSILLENGLQGLGLVLLLLFLFLNVRTAFWVAAGIPAAMSAAIALMYLSGLTINIISLFALIITLGIVVDDAIVIGEHADFRARVLGEVPMEAAENAAKRMFTPVFSATLTTVIAFFGLVAIGGRFGDLIADIPFTVIVVLIASLAECFLVLPNHMAHSITNSNSIRWYDWPSHIMNYLLDQFKKFLFRPFIRFVIWARYPVFAAVVLALASQAVLFINGDVQWRFFNAPERSSITGNFAMTPGAKRADSITQMRAFQTAVEEVGATYEEKYGRNPVDFAMAEIGGNTGRGLAGADTKDPDQLGSIAVELIDADLRPYSSFAFVADLQDAVRRHPQVETISFRGWRSGPGGDALDVQFSGANAETLKAASEALKSALAQYPEVSAVEDTLAYDKEELILELTAQGQSLGLTIDALGRVLRNRLNGMEAASFPDGPRSATIRVEVPAGELTADFTDRMLIRTGTGDYVPLADIVTVQQRTGFSTVRRENGIQVISVTGDISEDDPVRAQAIITELEQTILPKIAEETQVAFNLAGLAEQEDDFRNDATRGLVLTLAGIFMTLAWIFSSWTRPLVVMAIIPFGLVGTIFGHWWHDIPMSLFSVIGLIGMVGIIINDSIVLVTTIDEYSKERGLFPAILDGVTDRLRPVLLTTLTTVLGLSPLLYETSSAAQFLKPTVITLVYGLGFGVVLVLIVVPALMAMQADVGAQVASFKRAWRGLSRGRGPRLPFAAAVVLVLAVFAMTLGSVMFNGGLPTLVLGLPMAAVLAPLQMGFVLFLVGSAGVLVAVYALSALVLALQLKR
ncbi:efflux RND transporter permease subunit [uncultured Planktomarina sp.]|uniref:efflux RND transporter permease subunit n=1 Tax=uncultured Planktomarina sp. TaxID=1538529 RepID=UPI0032609894